MSAAPILIVEASAGSGKTYELAQRFVRLLLGERNPDRTAALRQILAITFTNRATREMKERVLLFLKRLALGRGESELCGRLARENGISEAEVAEAAAETVDAILRHFSSFQIQTIDSFIKLLLNCCSRELGLSARFRIKENTRQYLSYSVDEFLEACIQDTHRQEQLRNFLNHYLAVQPDPAWQLKRELIGVFSELLAARHRFGADFRPPPYQPGELFALKRELRQSIELLQQGLPDGVNKRFTNGLAGFLEKCECFVDFGVCESSAALRKETIPLNKGKTIDPQWEELWAKIRRGLALAAQAEAEQFFDAYMALFRQVESNFAGRSRSEDVLFLDTLNERCGQLFSRRQVSMPELFYRLANRFRHVLVDEFQDTSRLQWHNLQPIVSEALSGGGTLFYVGDKKQAIYRFRGGDVSLFDHAGEAYAGYTVARHRLAVNFRSAEEIVSFNNELFCPDNIRRFLSAAQPEDSADPAYLSAEALELLCEPFLRARQQSRPEKPGGLVTIRNVSVREEESAEQAVQREFTELVREIGRRRSWAQIGILCRTNEESARISEWLAQAQIPAESERTVNILNNAVVQELLCLLRFVARIDQAAAFSGFLFGELAERACGISFSDRESLVLEARRLNRPAPGLPELFRARWPDVWERYLEQVVAQGMGIPVYELLAALIQRFGVFDHCPESQGPVLRLLELAKQKEADYLSVQDFLFYLEQASPQELAVKNTAADAVKIQTTHKAKGLSFGVVIVPFFPAQWRTVKVNASVVEYGEAGLQQIRIAKKYALFSPAVRARYAEEYRRTVQDELNTWYVCCTRAEEELHLIRLLTDKDDPACFLSPPPDRQRGSIPARSRHFPAAGSVRDIAPPHMTDWISYLADEFGDDVRTLPRHRQRGEFVHALLAAIPGRVQSAGAAQFCRAAVRQVLPDFPGMETADTDWAHWLEELITAPEFAGVFAPPGTPQVYRELNVCDPEGVLRRIDRLLEYPERIVIFEFKTSSAGGVRHRSQVHEYMRIVRTLYPRKRVEAAVVYVDEHRISPVL